MLRKLALLTLLPIIGFACSPPPEVEPPSAECVEYCDLAMGTCLEDDALFASREECELVCADYRATGMDGEKKGNTVQCRIQHLKFAQTAPSQHCPHGGPTGAGVCVDGNDPCAVYCAGIQENCALGDAIQYDSIETCRAECLNFRTDGAPGSTTGNTVQCRSSFVFQADPSLTPVQACNEAGAGSVSCQDEAPMEGDMSADMADM